MIIIILYSKQTSWLYWNKNQLVDSAKSDDNEIINGDSVLVYRHTFVIKSTWDLQSNIFDFFLYKFLVSTFSWFSMIAGQFNIKAIFTICKMETTHVRVVFCNMFDILLKLYVPMSS